MVLSLGTSRLPSNRQRLRRSDDPTGKPGVLSPDTTFLIRNYDKCYLCRFLSNESAHLPEILCWDDSIQINNTSHDRLMSLGSTCTYAMQDVSHDCESNHRHSLVLCEKSSSNFVAALPRPAPALSLSIILPHSKNITISPLLQVAIKRQLVGCRVLSSDFGCTVRLKVLENVFTVQVQAVAAAAMSQTYYLYVIMPSTRITLLYTATTEAPQSSISRAALSPAALRLAEAIECPFPHVPRAFLLSGPPGVGKTTAVRQAVESTSYPWVALHGSDLLSHSQPARALQRHFRDHVLIFLDECDALLSSEPMAATLASLLDQRIQTWPRLIVVAATNRVDNLPEFVRRRFDCEIPMAPPSAMERRSLLRNLIAEILGDNATFLPNDLDEIADACVGYVAADLASLVHEAAMTLANNDHDSLSLTERLRRAMSSVVASALRDARLSSPPQMGWEDVAGDPGGAKTALQQAVEWPQTKAEAFCRLGLQAPRGILLYGPPGCAKTTLARAAAGASGVAFMSLGPADVYATSYVGDAEAIIRRAFTLARSSTPCILFFDEIDSIIGSDGTPSSGFGMNRGHSVEARVLSTFLNEMDGIDGSRDDGVLVLGATNQPWTLDAALLRPGRFDKVIYVPPPDFEGRRSLLEMLCKRWQSREESFDIDHLASDSVSGGMTGAEIVGACHEAAMRAIREAMDRGSLESVQVTQAVLERALEGVKPLLSNPSVHTRFETFKEGIYIQ